MLESNNPIQAGENPPAPIPVTRVEVPARTPRKRDFWLLGIGLGVGLALGLLLALGALTTYRFVTHTIPTTRDSVLVFNELNELRQQLNALNEERKLKEQEKESAVRQALQAVAATVPPPDKPKPAADLTAKTSAVDTEKDRINKPHDPFADIDVEVKRLEQTQKVLNTILDMLSTKAIEREQVR